MLDTVFFLGTQLRRIRPGRLILSIFLALIEMTKTSPNAKADICQLNWPTHSYSFHDKAETPRLEVGQVGSEQGKYRASGSFSARVTTISQTLGLQLGKAFGSIGGACFAKMCGGKFPFIWGTRFWDPNKLHQTRKHILQQDSFGVPLTIT